MGRIHFLDGHRGIAILFVVMFHAFSRWTELIPYGNEYGEFPLFHYGYLGVQLFFLLSGFVILMTLEKCNHFLNFIFRRWLRLFPAMLICSIIIFFTSSLFIERPSGQPELKDLLPGLTFVDPYIWLKLTGMELHSLEGAFWSIYVEFKFYIVAGLLYFRIGSQKLVYALFLCFIAYFIFYYANNNSSIKLVSWLHSLTNVLGFKYFGWFSAGAAYYLYTKTKNSKWLFYGILFSLISSLIGSNLNIGVLMVNTILSLFFTASIISTRLQEIISNRIFMFLGFVSYPLYLIHENMMISIIIKLGNHTTILPNYLFPLVAIIFISTLSYFISKNIEPTIKSMISFGFKKT